MDRNKKEFTHLDEAGTISRREFIRMAALLGISASSLSTFLAACAPKPTVSPGETPVPPTQTPSAEPKILRLRMESDIKNVDPAFHPASPDTATLHCVNEGLVSYRPGTWDVENVLAESIEQSEDGLRIDFKLKEGIQFHGGYGELTAEDVKFSYERFIDPELDAPYKGDWEPLDHVEVTGKYTGSIFLKEPFAPLWLSTLPVAAGMILSKKAVEEIGLQDYATSPIGTGPYEFVEWTANQRWVLKRFDGYWGEQPLWDEIQFLPIPEDSTAEVALEAGEVDFAYISEDSVDRLRANDNLKVIEIVTNNFYGVVMNVQHPKLEDINVRKAIRYGVDVPSIIEGAYAGKAMRACNPLSPGMPGYWEDGPCYERDVQKAKEFMAKAGLDTLDLTLTVMNGERERAVAEIIQANLADVGINVEIVVQDSATYWDEGCGEAGLQNRQLTYITWTTTNPDPSWITMWFTCDQILQWNWMYWCSEEFDQFHYGALSELDQAKRAEMYVDLQKVWDEAVNVMWIAHPNRYFAGRADLQPVVTPAGLPIPWAFT